MEELHAYDVTLGATLSLGLNGCTESEAASLLLAAVSIADDDPHAALRTLPSLAAVPPPVTCAGALLEARACIRCGRPEQARNAVRRAEAASSDIGARTLTALAAGELGCAFGDLDGAAAALDALDLDQIPGPLRGSFHLARARLLPRRGQRSDALLEAHRALIADPRDPRPLLFLARLTAPVLGLRPALGLVDIAASLGPRRDVERLRAILVDLERLDLEPQALDAFLSAEDLADEAVRDARLRPVVTQRADTAALRLAFAAHQLRAGRARETLDTLQDLPSGLADPLVAWSRVLEERALSLAAAPTEGQHQELVQERLRLVHEHRALEGRLAHFPFSQLLAVLGSSRFSGTVVVRRETDDATHIGTLDLCEGYVTSATAPGVQPSTDPSQEALDAVRELMTWTEGTFAYAPERAAIETDEVQLSVDFLVLEAARQLDEGGGW